VYLEQITLIVDEQQVKVTAGPPELGQGRSNLVALRSRATVDKNERIHLSYEVRLTYRKWKHPQAGSALSCP
jgi:hypothetical protein